MTVFNRPLSVRGLTVFGLETLLIAGSLVLAINVNGSPADVAVAFPHVVMITALFALCFYYNELYDLTTVHSKGELIIRILQAMGAAALILAALTTVFPSV